MSGSRAKPHRHDRIFAAVGMLCTAFALACLALLLVDIFAKGLPRLDWQFLTSFPSRLASRAGILSAWIGTLMVMLVTIVVSVPLGVGAAVYLEEYAPKNWLTFFIEVNISNLAGVPSIIFGLMALGLFAHKFGLGESVLTAGLTLGCLILPIIIVSTREALRAIPSGIREAALALGATKWQVIWNHLLPYSLPGISTGMIIGISRAIGETAPLVTIGALTFIAFLPPSPLQSEAPFLSFEWLMSPFTVLPIQMFNWISRPGQDFHVNAAAVGVVLLLITLAINLVAIVVRFRARRTLRW